MKGQQNLWMKTFLHGRLRGDLLFEIVQARSSRVWRERVFFSFLRKRLVLASDAYRIAHESAYVLAASSYEERIP